MSNPGSVGESKILKSLFLSSLGPFILQEISTAGAGFIDALVVSRFLSSEDLAVQGLGSPYYSVMGVVSGMIVIGMQTMCARAYGKGDKDKVNAYFSLAAVIGGVLSIILTALLIFGGNSIGAFFGASGSAADLLPSLKKFLLGLGIGTLPIVLFSILMPLVQMEGGRGAVRLAILAGIVVNVIGDCLTPLTGTEMFGIGLATSLSEIVQLVILVIYVINSKSSIHFLVKGIPWNEAGYMIRNGLPKATRRVANMLRPLMLNRLVLYLGGSAAMTAMSIRNSRDGIGDVVGSGIASSVMLVIGILYGEENKEGVVQVSRLGLKCILCFVGIVCAVFLIFAPWLAAFYANGNTNVEPIAVFAIRCMAVNLLFQAITDSYICFLQSTEQMKMTHIVNILSRFVFVTVCALAMGYTIGVKGVYLAFPVGSGLLLVSLVIYTAIRKRKVAVELYDVLGLPDDFGAEEKDILCYTVTSLDEGHSSRKDVIFDFCKEHGFPRKKAYHATLCLEEMVRNIVEYGFKLDNKKNHSVDVRIVAKEDDLILRVRDDCPLFNVKEKGEKWKENPEDPTAHIGIRLTMAAAKDFKYIDTLGTNSLIITV